jgi:uncharacterized repeat protein (TIGR03803 family)
MTTVVAHAQATTIFDFSSSSEGGNPNAGLVFDQAGNIYGTAGNGGANGLGVVFELKESGGTWIEQILHNFSVAPDGSGPGGSNLTLGPSGTLYGTTALGGSKNEGVAYLLVNNAGSWQEQIIHTFGKSTGDGRNPFGTLAMDAAGNLYGVTTSGGAFGAGTVFELKLSKTGSWGEKILYSFNSNGQDGNSPVCSLIFDAAGNLYGTTEAGGLYKGGTVFELLPEANGTWKEEILYNFHSRGTGDRGDADIPLAGVVMDASGNLYGTTTAGGSNDRGAVYRLSPQSGGGWKETILYSLNSNIDGLFGPTTGLTFDTAGNLYGTFEEGGTNFAGEVYVLKKQADGTWVKSTFYSFSDMSGGPAFPQSGLTLGPDGNFYGTTSGGGSIASGTAYSIAP